MDKKRAKMLGKFFRDACLNFTDDELVDVLKYIANVFDKKVEKDFRELEEILDNIIQKLTVEKEAKA